MEHKNAHSFLICRRKVSSLNLLINHGEHCCYSTACTALCINQPNTVGCNHECHLFCRIQLTQGNDSPQTHRVDQLTEGPVACPGSSSDCFLFIFLFPLDATVLEFLLGGLAVSSFRLSFASYLFLQFFKDVTTLLIWPER